ncbi:MAG: ADP-forming succinate--CoA ligase subunit beta [Alphaproteobacteria bacterium]|nr:ADP-forming succinate--CoA ligase subunit beta [Alphaproteobacteria bacterium]
MNIHEYQAKELLRRYGVLVPEGRMITSASDAESAAKTLGSAVTVVKSQIHAGGRGAGRFIGGDPDQGGVRVCSDHYSVVKAARAMLGQTLVTKQTGSAGKQVNRLYIEAGCDITRELYLSVLIDRATSTITFVASTEGGMDIETVAEETPGKILKVQVDPVVGVSGYHCRRIAFALGLSGGQIKSCTKFITGIYRAFTELDASLIEINPLVITGDGAVMALDAKMNFDDNALYRHSDISEMQDETEEAPLELEAVRYGLNYITLDGSIGCMVNGAGLAMATMDIIKLEGSSPANFLDVGGGATVDRVSAAFKIILSDKHVQGILVNIFGGIMRCDIIADGIVTAAKDIDIQVPLVVRLEGTNVEKGKEILQNSGLAIIAADDLGDAAKKIVAAVAES